MRLNITSPLEASLVSRMNAIKKNDYDAFIDQLYLDIYFQIKELQGYSSMYYNKSEDEITVFLVSNLKSMGYGCSHDKYHNGHVDLYIEDHLFKWLGECKLHAGNGYTNKGFKQLNDRYSEGNEFGNKGGILIYNQLKSKNTLDCMREWYNYLCEKPDFEPLKLKFSNFEPSKGRQYFDSTHAHVKSGMPYYIRYFFINLSFDPKDQPKKKKSK